MPKCFKQRPHPSSEKFCRGGGISDCFVADIEAGTSNNQLSISSNSSSFTSEGNWEIAVGDSAPTNLSEPAIFDLPNDQLRQKVTVIANDSAPDSPQTLILTASGELILPYFEIEADAAGTMVIRNKWQSDIIVNGTTIGTTSISISVAVGDKVTIEESNPNSTFRSWLSSGGAFVSGVSAHITSMPSLDAFTLDEAGTIAGDNFFLTFNYQGKLTSLPEGSFDTSSITTAGYNFFYSFNDSGVLASLPDGSFDISSLTTAGYNCFRSFNQSGLMTRFPEGSFNTSSIVSTGDNLFFYFNHNGQLTSLPAGSFDLSRMTTKATNFMGNFNGNNNYSMLQWAAAGMPTVGVNASAGSTTTLGGLIGTTWSSRNIGSGANMGYAQTVYE